MLVPEGYSPLSTPTENGIDSTVSDEYGRYGFSVDAPGAYNLFAKGNGCYALRQPVRISAAARVILDDEILLEPGSLSGMVHLEGESDHRGAIILLMGTNAYARPFDSTGAFSFVALAEGSYTMRVLTAKNDYAAVETTIAITSGMHTGMPCIELEKRYIPVVDSLSVRYDTAMMLVHLSWPAPDTAKIGNYAVYCNRSKNLKPVAMVDNSATVCTFDIFTSSIDTLRYQIAAIGNDGIEGPPTAEKLIVASGAATPDTVSCDISFSNLFQKLNFDSEGNIVVASGNKIFKLDSNGTYRGEFGFSDSTTIDDNSLRIDSAGNIYVLIQSRPRSQSLVKLDNSLRPAGAQPLDSSRNFSIAVSAGGAVMLFSPRRNGRSDSVGTDRWIYDPQFNLIRRDSIPETLAVVHSVFFADTTVCIFSGTEHSRFRIAYFNQAFNETASPITINGRFDGYAASIPQGYWPNSYRFSLVGKDRFAIVCVDPKASRSMLLFFDRSLQTVARVPIDLTGLGSLNLYFDSKGNWYGIPSSDKNTLLKFSIMKVTGTSQ
jgi:hypothetical protein